MNRVWPPMEEELWYTNVKVINQEFTPQQAAERIQRLHERNAYLNKAAGSAPRPAPKR